MLRKLFNKEKLPEGLVHEAQDLTQLDQKDLTAIIRRLLKQDPRNYDDMYTIFLRAKSDGLYRHMQKHTEATARLRCLTQLDQATVDTQLSATTPPDNILHALERIVQAGTLRDDFGRQAMLQFVLSSSHHKAVDCYNNQRSLVQMIEAARRNHHISDRTARTAKQAYCSLVDPLSIQEIRVAEGILDDQSYKLYHAIEERGLGSNKVSLMREWSGLYDDNIYRDEIQDIIDKGYGHSMKQAQTEHLARRLMKKYHVDRAQANAEIDRYEGDMEKAGKACEHHAKLAKEQLQTETIVPTRDTRSCPNITPRTRVISVLGIDELNASSVAASPSLGDGWMVSDFYLWMNVLHGMGKSQEWITTMSPHYLVNKYGLKDEVTMKAVDEPDVVKPVQTRWASGFVHGDPFENRKVVLDENLATQLQSRITQGPKGLALRDFFLDRVEATVADAAKNGDTVLIMIFSHGDYDTEGGLALGVDIEISSKYEPGDLLKPSHIASVLHKYPNVKCTIFMTSCYSGHWVETTEFNGSQLKPLILAASGRDQESFGFVWSHSQRHAGGLFSSATISELLKEPSQLPDDADQDTSRQYRHVINSLVGEMNRLCLPINIDEGYGSSPVFTDNESQERFWRRTGYSLYQYKANYDKLQTIPASDPHPKRDRKRFHAMFVDDSDPAIVAWNKRHPGILDVDYPEATGGYGGTLRGLVSFGTIRYLINIYLRSNPGFHTVEHRALMATIRLFYENSLNHDRKLVLRRELIHRLRVNKNANQYSKLLGLYRLPAIEQWTQALTAGNYDYRTFSKYAEKIARSGLFHAAKSRDGRHVPYYRKPSLYLAAAMVSAKYNEWEVEIAIKKLLNHRFGDNVTAHYTKTARYSRSVASIKSILRDSWNTSRTTPPSRTPLANIEWH
ncbi:hypothetical protein BDV25DRAFT_171567 [Aspergillus avenaceus]|uniref:Uncharacterized protein n=1 Tax=Aspergillus avenaceus TaxID=36643 RepID=A0A5N6TY95_ASPAV|nr:hypothetical protein BDV25DRAFT_171567 [Aspergillus avenaceus]